MTGLPPPPPPPPLSPPTPTAPSAPTTAPTPTATTKPARLASLDAFRGLTMAAMVLVNSPGSWSAIYPPLRHAEWHGYTPTDLIFPFFLFIVGVSMAFSARIPQSAAESRTTLLRVLKRGAILMALGLLLNLLGPVLDGLIKSDWSGLASVRLPGVLQRISLCYVAASLLIMYCKPWMQMMVILAIMTLYPHAFVLSASDPSDPFAAAENLARTIDLAILGPSHVWKAQPTDPEGLLSTLPALVTTLLGFAMGQRLVEARGHNVTRHRVVEDNNSVALSRVVVQQALMGAALIAAGWAGHMVIPINKTLWTPTYVLVTAGWAMAVLGACVWLIDVRGWRRLGKPLVILGLNAILLFVGSGILGRLIATLPTARLNPDSKPLSVKQWLFESLLATGLAPINASLAFALANVAVWFVVLWWLWRRGWFWKV